MNRDAKATTIPRRNASRLDSLKPNTIPTAEPTNARLMASEKQALDVFPGGQQLAHGQRDVLGHQRADRRAVGQQAKRHAQKRGRQHHQEFGMKEFHDLLLGE